MTFNNNHRLNADRISSLPDDVLCHILSFLPTKDSVSTRILSTRWTHLFKFVPTLDFEYGWINSTDADSAANTASNFIQFVNSVFILHKVSRMNKFRFYYCGSIHDPENYPIFSWISSAIDHNVQQIDICTFSDRPWTLPRDLFSCKTLTYLALQGSFRIVLPSSVCLPCLKTCNLVRVVFKDESARGLFRSCPALESLRLESCDMRGVEVLDISVPTLKNFFIHSHDDFQIVFNVPDLTYFEYVADGPAENEFLGLKTLKSLVKALIYYEQESDITDDVSIELVRGISHVQELCLYCGPMEAFVRLGHSLPTFNNLTRLTLGPMSNLSSQLLSNLLDNSPQLEFISFNQTYGYDLDGADQNNCVLSGHVPTCVSSHLKEVEFCPFSMLEYECKLIKYFLKNAKNLKKMHIQSSLIWDEQFEIGSAECQVVFDSDGVEEN